MLRPCALAALVVLAAGAAAQEATYRVYPPPVESPLHTLPLPPADARVLVTDPSDAAASPFGWHDTDGVPGAEFTTTQGNNALAYFDANGNHGPDAGELADGGPPLAFDFPLDYPSGTDGYAEAALTQLFFWTNYVHDVLYAYGFDEAAGNFQDNTYGHGGLGGDAVRVKALVGAGTSFFSPPDGGAGSMMADMSLWLVPPWSRALDNLTTVHELAHGLSIRLTGGPSNSGCLQNAEQAGEGWSDWYALMLTMREGDTRADPRDNPTRPAPYSTDFSINDYTYGDTQTAIVPHGVGFVWATILWEATWDLIDTYGFDPDLYDADGDAGNQIMLSLVTEGLKLQPCGPGFVDARDAILAADASLYGGAHIDLLWGAFARRGLGFSADQGSPNTNADNAEAFDVPGTTAAEPTPLPATLTLDPVAPNPTAGPAEVTFTLPAAGPVRLALYDVRGREVAVLLDAVQPAGRHTTRLDGRGLATGVYLLRLEAGGVARTRQVTLAR